MKVKELTKKMNDHGTRPRITVLCSSEWGRFIIYEGSPFDITNEAANLTVETFTVKGVGFIEIFAKRNITSEKDDD